MRCCSSAVLPTPGSPHSTNTRLSRAQTAPTIRSSMMRSARRSTSFIESRTAAPF
jgi:hypothetical protein